PISHAHYHTCFSISLHPPHCSPLFPYTTLFRSLSDHGRTLATRVMRKHRLAECLLVGVIKLPWEEVHIEACRWEHVISESVEHRDRKSTRLNSSHDQISYAVFCLKKKNEQTQQR